MQRPLSRRALLRGSAVMTTEIGMAKVALAAGQRAAEPGAAVMGPDAVPVTLTANGVEHALRVEPRTTLAEVLARPARADRHQDRLQPRRLLGLHGVARRRARVRRA